MAAMTLEELIPLYGQQKQDFDSLKKVVDTHNSEIKKLMLDGCMSEKTVDGYKATCSVTERETLNEVKLLEILKQAKINVNGLIKTREFVDMDVLEDAIYKDLIPEDVLVSMDTCREVKEVVTLRVTKAKPKKEED